MTFEEDFPSLKGKQVSTHDCVNTIVMLKEELMNNNEKGYEYFEKDIQEHCLDKQRVREAIEKCCGIYDGNRLLKELGL